MLIFTKHGRFRANSRNISTHQIMYALKYGRTSKLNYKYKTETEQICVIYKIDHYGNHVIITTYYV